MALLGVALSVSVAHAEQGDMVYGTMEAKASINTNLETIQANFDELWAALMTQAYLTTSTPRFAGLNLGTASTTTGLLNFYGNAKAFPFGLWSQGADTGSIGWRLPSTMPAGASVVSIDANGYLDYTLLSAFLTPTGAGGSLTVTATGFDGNLETTDNTVQEIAQKFDDFTSAGGYTNLTSFIAQSPWRLFYSDGSGDVKELALGADGEYLKSNGVSVIPSWATPSGAAHDAVTIGSPANGLSLATQVLSLGLASTSTTGALSDTDWDTFNNKVSGPASATDNAIAVFDSTTGKLIKVSGCTINATTNVISCSAADGSRYATLPNNTSAPASATVVNGFYTYLNELYGVENSGTASKVLLENDVDDTPSDGNTAQPASSNSVADHIAASNPHNITKTTVSLGNVDNTSNATERAATAALTNKDLSSATNTFPATLVTGPSSLEIFVLDDCSTATGMATGDLCFEF